METLYKLIAVRPVKRRTTSRILTESKGELECCCFLDDLQALVVYKLPRTEDQNDGLHS